MRILFLVWNRDGAGTVGFGRMVLLVLLSFVLVFGGSSPLLAEAGGVDDVLTSASIGVTEVDDVGVSVGGIETPSVAAPSSVEEVSRAAVVASMAVAGGLLPLDVVALGQTITINSIVNLYVHGNSSTPDGWYADLSPVGNRLDIMANGDVSRDAYGARGESSGTVNNNVVNLHGKVRGKVLGGQTNMSGSVTYNTVNIFAGGEIGSAAYGGHHEVAGGVADFNTINIKSGARVALMSQGGSALSSADNNTINVNGTTGSITGGNCFGGGHANNNRVTIGDGAMVQNLVYGGAGNGVVNNNTVEITGGTMTSYIYGGYSEGTQANNNTVIVSGNPTIKEIVSGGWATRGTGSGNTLIKNSPAYMPELRHFQTIRFGYSGNSGIGNIQTITRSPELIFDTGPYSITHSTRIAQFDGRFVKKGSGTLTLTPGATLVGLDIIVSEGTLRLAAGISLSLPFSLTRGHIVVMPGATLVVDEGVNINIAGAGKVTVGGSLENRGTLTNNAGSGGIVVESTGTLVNNGHITVNLLGVLTMNGTYAGNNRVYFNCNNLNNSNLNGSNAKSVPGTISMAKTYNGNRSVLAQPYIYDGKAKEPLVRILSQTMMSPTYVLTNGIEYSVRYENNINAGKAKVVISGIEPLWYDSYFDEFTISPADITTTAIASNPDCAYTGKPVAMKSVLTYMGMTLVNGRDYTVSYANNTNLGVATATITGIGNYTGTRTLNFSIVPKADISQSPDKDGNGTNTGTTTGSFKDKSGKTAALVISGLKNRAWTGKQIKPVVTVKAGSKNLKPGTDYTVSYGKNKDIGKGSLTIKGKGNYSGTNALTFRIVPKKPAGLKLTAGKTSLKVSWKKLSKAQNATGYQVQYRAVGSGKWTTRSVSAKAASLTLKKLKKGKQYQLRLRAYKTVSKVKYFSGWSKLKTGRLK